MIKAILIDDEESVRKDLRGKLVSHFSSQIEIIAEAESVATGIEAITQHKPELIFLDIHLLDGTGFDIIKGANYKDFEIIFVTGFDEHAIKAIKVGALDYILNNKAIDERNENNPIDKLIEISNEYFHGTKKKRVIFKTSENVYAVYEDDILYCSSEGNYTTIHTKEPEKILVSKPIKKIEEILSEQIFIRCHQSYLVNTDYVLKYSKQGFLMLAQDIKVPVSNRRKEYVLSKVFN